MNSKQQASRINALWHHMIPRLLQSLALPSIALMLNGCISGSLYESNAKYACYVNEFDTKPLSAPGDDYTYRGVKRSNNGQDSEYIVTGVFSDSNRCLRITIPKSARGIGVKSSSSSYAIRTFCENSANEHAAMDVTSFSNEGEHAVIRFRKWCKLHDLFYPGPGCTNIPRGVIVYYDVSAGINAILFKRESDGEYVILPVTADVEWTLRSRTAMFMRRSSYILTIAIDIVTLPIQMIHALSHLGDC